VLSLLDKLLDLPRELRLGATWLVVATLLVGADAYAIARFDRALLTVLAQADALAAVQPTLGALLTEGLCALTTLILVWFYVMPTAAFGWRQFVGWCRLHMPEWWASELRYPRSGAGWEWIPLARMRAIEEDNAVLFSACERRVAEVKARDLVLRCVLAVIVLSFTALIASTPATGPSLIGAAYAWLDQLPKGYVFILFALALPACAFASAVLFDRGVEFDSHIQLSAKKADRDRSS
jgi:hypothetical protein